MSRNAGGRVLIMVLTMAVLSVIAGGQGITDPKQGKGGSAVKGSAGPEGSRGDTGLEHCDKPMGALAVVEPQDYILVSLRRYNLGSPVGLIRLMVQQSNCFIVVERGVGMQNLMQERELASAGQLRQDSNVGGGQMVTADFVLTPAVVFKENNAGGMGGAVAGMFGKRAAAAGAVAGGLKFKEAQTSMLVADARSSVQVAAAEGSTRKADMGVGGALFGGGTAAAAGGYGNTNEGKIIAASFMDNYNKIVQSVRNDPSLQRNVGTLKQEAAAGGTTKAGAVFEEGDVLTPKIANVRLVAEPTDTAKVVATLSRGEELVVIGAAKDGYIKVQTATATGWVRTVLVVRQ
jgi:curli production assembly/transport component CsgG